MAQADDKTTEDGTSTGGSFEADSYPWLKNYPSHAIWLDRFEGQSLTDMFDDSVARYGANVCTWFLGKSLTYAQIDSLVRKAAAGLQRHGVLEGKRVGLFLPNCPTYIIYYFAILKAGGTVVNYNPLYSLDELAYQIKDSQTDVMVTLDLKILFEKVEALLERGDLAQAVVCPFAELLPSVKGALFSVFKRKDLSNIEKSSQRKSILTQKELMKDRYKLSPVTVVPDEDIAVLQYTGGTTGVPKGAMLTHSNLSINQQQIMAWQNHLTEGQETFIAILPLFHVFAMTTVMNFGLSIGARLILIPKFELDSGLKLIHKEKPTVMPGVPTLYNAISNHPKLEQYDLTSLKFCISGGAALPIEVKREFESLTGCSLVEGYGLSETSPVATCNPVGGLVKEGSIGIPLPRTRISIRSLEDPSQEMPLGEKGEICISGPQVMKGYWKKPEETETAFVEEYFRTGDVGYMDEDGFTFIVDRIKDLIITSGFNIYPRRIEEAIYQHSAVEDVIVLGIPNDMKGEVPKAYIKLKERAEATAEEIQRFIQPKLSKLEWPKEIEFRDELPKTMIGKLSKKDLRDEEQKKG